MNIKIDLNLNANEELANALLTIAAIMHSSAKDNGNNPCFIGDKPLIQKDEKIENEAMDKQQKETLESKTMEQAPSLEQVRARLVILSQTQIREILSKFGAKKLTQVRKENLGAVLKEAEAIINSQ